MSVVCKHDSTGTQNDASEDGSEELEESLLLNNLFDADASVGHQTITVDVLILVEARFRGVREHCELFWPQVALRVVVDLVACTVRVL